MLLSCNLQPATCACYCWLIAAGLLLLCQTLGQQLCLLLTGVGDAAAAAAVQVVSNHISQLRPYLACSKASSLRGALMAATGSVLLQVSAEARLTVALLQLFTVCSMGLATKISSLDTAWGSSCTSS